MEKKFDKRKKLFLYLTRQKKNFSDKYRVDTKKKKKMKDAKVVRKVLCK